MYNKQFDRRRHEWGREARRRVSPRNQWLFSRYLARIVVLLHLISAPTGAVIKLSAECGRNASHEWLPIFKLVQLFKSTPPFRNFILPATQPIIVCVSSRKCIRKWGLKKERDGKLFTLQSEMHLMRIGCEEIKLRSFVIFPSIQWMTYLSNIVLN